MCADILDELGNPAVNSLEKFKNVLTIMCERYPDMIPLVVNPFWYKSYSILQFGVQGGSNTFNASLESEGYRFDNQCDKANEELRNGKGAFWWGMLAGNAVNKLLGCYSPEFEATKSNREMTALATFMPALGLVAPDADTQEQVIQNNINNMFKNDEVKVMMAESEEEAHEAYANMLTQDKNIELAELGAWANEHHAQAKEHFN